MNTERFHTYYETDRLILKILDESASSKVLTFLLEGAKIFDEYESEKPSDFYTLQVQSSILRAEYNMATHKTGVRFYVFLKDDPASVIGTISFSFIKHSPFDSAMLGYKFLPSYWHQGFAGESVKKAIEIASSVFDLKRIESYVLPENRPSQTLLSRLNFRLEGTAFNCIEVRGIRRDHLQYSLDISEL